MAKQTFYSLIMVVMGHAVVTGRPSESKLAGASRNCHPGHAGSSEAPSSLMNCARTSIRRLLALVGSLPRTPAAFPASHPVLGSVPGGD